MGGAPRPPAALHRSWLRVKEPVAVKSNSGCLGGGSRRKTSTKMQKRSDARFFLRSGRVDLAIVWPQS